MIRLVVCAVLLISLAGCAASGTYVVAARQVPPLETDAPGTERCELQITVEGSHVLGVWLENGDGSETDAQFTVAHAFLNNRGATTHVVHVVNEPHPDTESLRRLRIVSLHDGEALPTRDAWLFRDDRLVLTGAVGTLLCSQPTAVIHAGESRVMVRALHDRTPGGITPPS